MIVFTLFIAASIGAVSMEMPPMELASTVPKAPASNEEATMMNEEETIGFSTSASFDNPDSIEQRKGQIHYGSEQLKNVTSHISHFVLD